jgi:hypothetical protein
LKVSTGEFDQVVSSNSTGSPKIKQPDRRKVSINIEINFIG